MMVILMSLLFGMAAPGQEEVVGKRPYEMDWANRTEDDHPPLIDFENLDGWAVETEDSEATFERSREQQIWGQYVGKLTYRGTGRNPNVWIRPPDPVPISEPFDAVTCWIYGNNWGWVPDPTTPQVAVSALFVDSDGEEFGVQLETVRWKEWFLCHRRLTEEQIGRAEAGCRLSGFNVRGGRNEEDRAIYFDNLAVFTEELKPLTFQPRRERGIPMFPGQGTGTNTGPGKLPFPTRLETILPTNGRPPGGYKVLAFDENGEFRLVYADAETDFDVSIAPNTGTLGDFRISRGDPGAPAWSLTPCADGGVYFATDDGPKPPERAEHLGTELQDDPEFAGGEHRSEDARKVVSRWRMHLGDRSAEVTYTYRLWRQSLVIDVVAPGGEIAEVRYGHCEGAENPRLVTLPYYPMGAGQSRPAVMVFDTEAGPCFLMGNTCWYLSNASAPFAINEIKDGEVTYNGGTRYVPKTDGQRNDCYERFFLTVSNRFEEVLPTIPNPESPWKHITGTRVWRAHGASNRENDAAHWRRCHRYGMTEVVITDHETGWRDGGESFTFRTRPAPGKGGYEGQYEYARIMQDELGFVYGPYNNYTDFAPVNEFWSADRVNRQPDNQLQRAWPRCYAPKPAIAVEFCDLLAPQIEEKFHFSTAYCDVHTAVAPWDRVDYDYRVPGAGTFAAVFYSYGEIMLLQKAAWDGPVYSEGNNHAFYCGLTDGNYGQDQRYGTAFNPWLVDFDLRKLHDLCCNFGMGNPGMFYGRNYNLGSTREEMDRSIDRFLAATVAFGHPGFLAYEGGIHNALRSYYMLQQLHSQYCLSSADEIRYADEEGNLLDTTTAVATGAFKRSQVACRYANGCVTVANGSTEERMKVNAWGREVDLPPNGYAGWMPDGSIEVMSADPTGHRCDYAVTPAYAYVDGRGRFVRLEKAAGNGIGICRSLGEGKHELILYDGAEAGFAIGNASAVALAEDRSELGPAEVRVARGLTYVVPVEGAFSYMLTSTDAAEVGLTCDRERVVAGETVVVRGNEEHEAQIPADAEPADRVWLSFEGGWIDFTVAPLVEAEVRLAENTVSLELTSNLAKRTGAGVTLGAAQERTELVPAEPVELQFDLGKPERESADVLRFEITAGDYVQALERAVITRRGYEPLVPFPEKHQTGMRLRGEEETSDFADTRAYVGPGRSTCGDETKEGLSMHPPWVGGVGYSFALYDPVRVPGEPSAFRAWVGKKDGSDPGDGILYKVGVVDAQGKETIGGETTVTEHEWLPIEADLTPWAGQEVRLKLISDVGVEDNSSGDWACWAGMRVETLEEKLTRRLVPDAERYRREPGPYAVGGLTVTDLRQATAGWLRYDGMGLSGTGEYGTTAVLNGITLGDMAPAGGSETQGVWEENVGVPLTAEAIKALGVRNVFVLQNPRQDWFKVRRFWIELELADGRKCSSDISSAAFTQPPTWPYAEGVLVPHGIDIEVDIWFDVNE